MILSLVSGEYFFKAAREAQLYSLNRVIQVATKDIMRDLHDHAYDIATTLSVKGKIPGEFRKAAQSGYTENLVRVLDDPFVTGFVGAHIVKLVKIRAYDLTFRFVAEGNEGIQGLPQQIPQTLYLQGYDRKGAERAKAVSGLWQHDDESYYSVLVPMGGVFVSGYLEIVVDPVVSLVKLSDKMGSPISIRSGINPDKVYYESEQAIAELLPIEYALETSLGAPAYILTSYEDIAKLGESVNKTVFSSISMFVGLVVIVLLVAIWLFQLFLFKPLNIMLDQIRNITDGDFSRDLEIKGLAEIDVLADEFNKMAKEIRSREEALTRLSVIDGLTRISNRRKFDEVLNNEYLIASRTRSPLSVIMVDIDYFKHFNDTYGHLAGDECLKKVAAALQGSISRPADLVARYGGEEFAVVLPNTSENGEHVVARKIMSEIASLAIPHSGSEVGDNVTVSIGGYTLTPSAHHDPVYIVAEADKSLYQAKNAGRNQFILRRE